MGGQLAAVLPRAGCKSGVSSTQRAAKLTATGIRALILRRFVNGGMAFLQKQEGLDLDNRIWYNKQYRI